MSETQRCNIIRALDLRHDEVLDSLADLDRQVEEALVLIKPPAAAEASGPAERKKRSAA
jgi:hypothetical protein